MPVKPAILSDEFLTDLNLKEASNGHEETMEVDATENEHFLETEKRLCDLVRSGNLHWRHHQMAIGMLLTLLVNEHKPPENVVNMWLDCMLHDDVTIRAIAFQVKKIIVKK